MKRLGRGGNDVYEVGDAVRVQDTHSGQWSLKGVVSEVIHHDDSPSRMYQVTSEDGGTYLRNGRFVKLRISKVRRKKMVTFAPSVVGGGVACLGLCDCD